MMTHDSRLTAFPIHVSRFTDIPSHGGLSLGREKTTQKILRAVEERTSVYPHNIKLNQEEIWR